MKIHHLYRLLSVFTTLSIAFLIFGAHTAAGAPPAPVPVSPAGGSTIVIPTFSWQAASGAVKYEIEVGPQSNPNTVYWSDQTVNLTLTPLDATDFANIPLYWRVRGYDNLNAPGTWSSKINFTKQLPAPVLVSPAEGELLISRQYQWLAVEGAAYYRVELSTSSNFLVVEATYDSYNLSLIPVSTLPHGRHYWRVTAMDAAGNPGTPSAGRYFDKYIPAPVLTSPYNGHPNLHIPNLEWQVTEGVAYYQVEISASDTFVPVLESYTTYNTYLTPVDTFAHGTFYWRVSGVDADGHVGTPSSGWSFTKTTDAPVLINPGIDPTISIPTMEWASVPGAAYYRVELSANSGFVPVLETYNTYNLQVTPVDKLVPGSYYWRVSGVDAGGNVGNNNWRRFDLIAPLAATDVVPLLTSPANTAVITVDPSFGWSRSVGADHYRLIVSKDADFIPIYESVTTDYSSYTPYAAGTHDAYPNGTYYWMVEAYNASNIKIATSLARSFTRQQTQPLTGPGDGVTGLLVDPTFQWQQIVGAKTYRLVVSEYSDFHATYDNIVTDYNSYTPYTPGDHDAYPNGTYYWRVEARNSANVIITTSAARSFTKQETLALNAPADGAALLLDPNFRWSRIVGAKTYRLVVSEYSDFHATYDSIVADYTGYTPYTPGDHDAYPNGTYYWRVEARNAANIIITTSAARSFTKQEPLPLVAPPDRTIKLVSDPTFQWQQIVGAKTYRLVISKYADFHATYNSVVADYCTYTPYAAGTQQGYPKGLYYWKVEARNSANVIITTSDAWTFHIGYGLYIPAIKKSP